VGQTPWSARVPLDPLPHVQDQALTRSGKPARGPAAGEGARPTTYAGARLREDEVALGSMAAAQMGG